ncbi:hypothetical protein BBJ28_00019931, partial [Nothophytophthora sp. Chile5]
MAAFTIVLPPKMAKTGEGEQERLAMQRDVAASLARAGASKPADASVALLAPPDAAAAHEAALLSRLLLFFSHTSAVDLGVEAATPQPSDEEQALIAAFLATPRASQKTLAQSLFVAPDALVRDFSPVLQFLLRVMMAAHALSHARDRREARTVSDCTWPENALATCITTEHEESSGGSDEGGVAIAFRLPESFHACLVAHYGSVKRLKCEEVWHGDHMAYRCRTCGLSDSSCMCLACFDPDEHEGHDFRVYRCSSGGCCDCGDPLAWKPEGFCKKHSAQRAAAVAPTAVDAEERRKMRMDPEEDAMVQMLVRRAVEFCVHVLREVHLACLRPSGGDNGDPFYPRRTLPKTGQRRASLPAAVQVHVARLQQTLAWLQMLAMSCLYYRNMISDVFFEELPAEFQLDAASTQGTDAVNQSQREAAEEEDEEAEEEHTQDNLLILDVFLKAGVLLPVETCDVLGVLYLKLLFDQSFKQKYTCHFVEWYPYFIELYLSASDESNEDGMRNLSRFIDRLFCQLFHSNAQLRELETVFASMRASSRQDETHQRRHRRPRAQHRFGIPVLASGSTSSSCVEWLMVFLLEKLNDLFRSTLRLMTIQPQSLLHADPIATRNGSFSADREGVGPVTGAPPVLRTTQVVDCGRNVFKKRIYARLCSDLRTLLVHPQIAAEVLLRSFRCIGGEECALREASVYAQLMKTFELLQQMDLQTRHVHRHIEYESQNWTFAFVADYELKLLLSAFLTGIPACFSPEVWQSIGIQDNSEEPGATSVITGGTPLNPMETATFRPIVLARALLQPVRAALKQWAQRNGRPELQSETAEASVVALGPGEAVNGAKTPTLAQLMEYYEQGTVPLGGAAKSFHLPLHHMYAALVHSLCNVVRPQTLSEWRELLGMGVEEMQEKKDLTFWYSAVDHPLRVLLFSREIKSGLWVRNGSVMLQQLIHYHSKHWRYFGLHSDLFLCQLGASLLPHGRFARLFFHQLPFGLRDSRVFALDGDDSAASDNADQSRELRQELDVAEEALRLFLQLVLAPVKLTSSSAPETSAVWLLEREMMHWLTLGPFTRSEIVMRTDMKLVEQIKQLPAHKWAELEEEEILTNVLESVGLYDDPSVGCGGGSRTPATRGGSLLGYGLKMSGSWKLKPELWTRVSPLFECFTPSEAQQCEQNIRKTLRKAPSSEQETSLVLPMLPEPQQEGASGVNMHLVLAETMLNSSYLAGALLVVLETCKREAVAQQHSQQRREEDRVASTTTTNENLLLAALHCLYVAIQMLPAPVEAQQQIVQPVAEESDADKSRWTLTDVARCFDEDSSIFYKLCIEIPMRSAGDGQDQAQEDTSCNLLSLLLFFSERESAMEDTKPVVERILRIVSAKSPVCAEYIDAVKRRQQETQTNGMREASKASDGRENGGEGGEQPEVSAKELMKRRQQQILEKMRSQQMQFLSSNGDAKEETMVTSRKVSEATDVEMDLSSDEDGAMDSEEDSEEHEEEDDEWGFPTGQVDVRLYLDHVSSAIAQMWEKQRKTQERKRRRRRSTRSSSLAMENEDESGRTSSISYESGATDGQAAETEECGLCRLPCDSKLRGSSFGFVGMILPTNMTQKMENGAPNRSTDPDVRPHPTSRLPSLRVLKPGTMDEMRLQLADAVIWSCGHAIHHACLKAYLMSLWKQKQGRNPLEMAGGEDRLLSERDMEFVCPICRRLSNCLVPRVSLSELKQQAMGFGGSIVDMEIGAEEEEEETKDDGQDPLGFLQWLDTQMSFRDDSPVVKRRRSRTESSLRLRRRLLSSASRSSLSPGSRSSSDSSSMRCELEGTEQDVSVECEIGSFCHEIVLRCVRAQLHLPTLLTGSIRDEGSLDLEMQQLSSECGAQLPAWQLLLHCLEVQLRVVAREQTLLGTDAVDPLQLRSMRQLAAVAATAVAFSTPSSLAWTVVEAPADKRFESVMTRLNGLLFGQQVLFEQDDDVVNSSGWSASDHFHDRDNATEEALVGTPVLCHRRLLTCFAMRVMWRQSITTPSADAAAVQLLSEAFFSARVLLTAQVLQALACLRMQAEQQATTTEGNGEVEGKADQEIGDFQTVESLRDASMWISQVLVRSRLVDRKPQKEAKKPTRRWNAAAVEEQVSARCLPLAQQMLLLMDVVLPTPPPHRIDHNHGEGEGKTPQNASESCAVCDGLFTSPSASASAAVGSSGPPSASTLLAKCLRRLHLPPLRLFFHRQMFSSSQRALCQLWGAQLEAKAAVSRQQARTRSLAIYPGSPMRIDAFPLRKEMALLSSRAAAAGAHSKLLVPLPRVYMDLFIRYNEKPAGVCRRCAQVPQHPGLCLFCGEVLCCFSACCEAKEGGGVGECSQHAQRCGLGLGAFLLLRACTVILFLGNERRCVWGSLY